MNHPSIDQTVALAARLHAGQRDKAGVPYIAHPLAVMRSSPEPTWHVAVLHDALEDTDITAHRLLALGYTPEEVGAIELLTRMPDESYESFIERIATSGNELAVAVKIADLTDNLDPNRPEIPDSSREEQAARQKRYRIALYRLMAVPEE